MKNHTILRLNKDFCRLYSYGKSFVSPVLVTYVMKNKVGHLRVGITASKKTGGAILRNRSRRIIKEAYRGMHLSENVPFDLVFVARGKTPYAKTQDIFKFMSVHLKESGIIKKL